MTAHILVVDDEPDVEALILQKFRHKIPGGAISFLFARDGVEALAALPRSTRRPARNGAALREFDGHVLRLAQIINRAEPERFARTSVDVDKLLQLSRFLAEVAGQQPQCADGHPAA